MDVTKGSDDVTSVIARERQAKAARKAQEAERNALMAQAQLSILDFIQERSEQEKKELDERILNAKADEREELIQQAFMQRIARRRDLEAAFDGIFSVDGVSLVIETKTPKGVEKSAKFRESASAARFAAAVREKGMEWRAVPQYPTEWLVEKEASWERKWRSWQRNRDKVYAHEQAILKRDSPRLAEVLATKGIHPETIEAPVLAGPSWRDAALLEVAAETTPTLRGSLGVKDTTRSYDYETPPERIVVVETALDAYAHYQMNPEEGAKSAYFSLGGLPITDEKKQALVRLTLDRHWESGSNKFEVVNALGNSEEAAKAAGRIRGGARKSVSYPRQPPPNGKSWVEANLSRQREWMRKQGIKVESAGPALGLTA